jgi:hypothetical protein
VNLHKNVSRLSTARPTGEGSLTDNQLIASLQRKLSFPANIHLKIHRHQVHLRENSRNLRGWMLFDHIESQCVINFTPSATLPAECQASGQRFFGTAFPTRDHCECSEAPKHPKWGCSSSTSESILGYGASKPQCCLSLRIPI